MLSDQQNACAACETPFSMIVSKHNPICIDHDHATGEVRGLLCSPCNLAAGKFERRGEVVMRYLARHELDIRDFCKAA